jgi:hypothetical protein
LALHLPSLVFVSFFLLLFQYNTIQRSYSFPPATFLAVISTRSLRTSVPFSWAVNFYS